MTAQRWGSGAALALGLCLGVSAGDAAAAGKVPAAGVVELDNLCRVRVLTSGPYDYTHAFPTSRGFVREGSAAFVESAGPGPDGVVRKNVRHLMTIDLETARLKYLAATVHPKADQTAGWMMFDSAPAANLVVYADAEGRRIHALNLASGGGGVVLDQADSTISGPLSVAADGTRVAWAAVLPADDSRWFEATVSVILAQDIDPVTCKPVGSPRIVEAYPRRKGPTWKSDNTRDGVHVSRPQINPHNRDHLCFAHELLGSAPDGSVARSQLWQTMVDEERKMPLIRQPAGVIFGSSVFTPGGRALLFTCPGGFGQVAFEGLGAERLFHDPALKLGHLAVSPDGRWVAADTLNDWTDKAGARLQSIVLIERATRRYAYLCWFPLSEPHPQFSPDGRSIVFAVRDAQGRQQIAVIGIADVQARWAEVHQGTGAEGPEDWK